MCKSAGLCRSPLGCCIGYSRVASLIDPPRQKKRVGGHRAHAIDACEMSRRQVRVERSAKSRKV